MLSEGIDLDALASELCEKHQAHTVILYGSRARGDARPTSDIDVFLVRDEGSATSDHRLWRGLWLDAWVHPSGDLDAPEEGMLRLCGGRVLVERDGSGAALIARLEATRDAGPKALTDEDRALRVTWLRKTAARVRDPARDDLEAMLRRASLLTESIETYFALRERWYPGPRGAFEHLRREDPETCARYAEALRDASVNVDALVERVLAGE